MRGFRSLEEGALAERVALEHHVALSKSGIQNTSGMQRAVRIQTCFGSFGKEENERKGEAELPVRLCSIFLTPDTAPTTKGIPQNTLRV